MKAAGSSFGERRIVLERARCRKRVSPMSEQNRDDVRLANVCFEPRWSHCAEGNDQFRACCSIAKQSFKQTSDLKDPSARIERGPQAHFSPSRALANGQRHVVLVQMRNGFKL